MSEMSKSNDVEIDVFALCIERAEKGSCGKRHSLLKGMLNAANYPAERCGDYRGLVGEWYACIAP